MAATDRNDPSLAFTLPLQLTKTIRRQVYDTVSPENPANSQAGKIVVITGGGSGIGKASFYALLVGVGRGADLDAYRQLLTFGLARVPKAL